MRRSCDQTQLRNLNLRQNTTDLDGLLGGHKVTAVVDKGADDCVIKGCFASKVKKE